MPVPGYEETLKRFGLESLKTRVDLQVSKSGDIAVTRDGDLQMGDTKINALFRFVERWRYSESTINDLFNSAASAAKQLHELSRAREENEGPSLTIDPKAYHEVTESILEYQSVSSVLSGAIFVVLNNLLQRFRLDLNATDDQWTLAGKTIESYSIGDIVWSGAANFRHHDEWASTKTPTRTQHRSMEVICGVLKYPLQVPKGFPTIRTNVCGIVLMRICEGSAERLHQIAFDYAKAVARY
jgi:hypothetical protein